MNIVGNHLIDLQDCILCCFCETRVAFIEDYIPNAQDLMYGGYFNRMFHIFIDNANLRQQPNGNTAANIYCIQCRILLGWLLLVVTQPSEYFIVGRYFIRLKQLMYQSGVTLHDSLFGGANEQAPNEQNADQDVGANAEQDGGAKNQVEGSNADSGVGTNSEQDGGANPDQDGGASADHDEGANDQVPDEQELGADEQNVDQDEDAYEEDHDQDEDAYEQDDDQDEDAYEQNHDQDEDSYEQDHDQDEDAYDQDYDPDEDAYEQDHDQDEDTYDQDHDQDEDDEGPPMKRRKK